MKPTKHILLLAAMLLCCLTVSAEAVQIEGIWYNLVPKAKQAEVTKPTDETKYSGDIVIPSSVSYEGIEYRVTSIAEYAFNGCTTLTSITIPESVTLIGSYTFKDCSRLTAVHISSIEAWCKISFESTPDANPLKYAKNLYLNGELVTKLVIPEGVTSIKYSAFYNCTSLTSIDIPKSVVSIGISAFSGCTSLTSINIPENMTRIRSGGFSDCSSLTAVHISSIEAWCKISFDDDGSNPLISAHNLYLNGKLITELIIPESVREIKEYAFMGCSTLTSITIPESVTLIGRCAFKDCSGLTSITIPEGVTGIRWSAFEGCSSLTSVVLPKSVMSIYSEAFANCPELLDVYCYAESVPSATADAFEGSYPEYATLRVPASAVESYKATAPWSSFGTIVSLDATITHISLNKTDVTLTEGESSLLTFTTTPEDADRNLFSWNSSNPSVATVDGTGNVTAIAPGIATITVTANDGSGLSASCEVTVKKRVQGTCAAPIISYAEGKIVLTCETEGAKVITDVVAEDAQRYEGLEIALSAAYTITAYATKEGYLDSDPVTLTLCWVPCTEEHEDDDTDGIITLPAKPVLIQTAGGVITLTGLPEGAEVAVYDTAATLLAAATAENGTATLTTNLNTGSTAIVKIGGHSVKVVVK